MVKKTAQLPLAFAMPPSDWTAPTELPDLRRVDKIAIDLETRDDGIADDLGAAWPWRGGYVAGFSAAWREGEAIRAMYVPLTHPDTVNISREVAAAWLRDHVSAAEVITHYGAYDWGWLRTDLGIKFGQRHADTQAMAMMVDENRQSYSLAALCDWRGLPGKDESLLNKAAALYGVDPKSGMWMLPARYVGPYAEQDAIATLTLSESLAPEIDRQELGDALRLEHDLMPMVLEMRLRGIRINEERAHESRARVLAERDAVLEEIGARTNRKLRIEDLRSPKSLQVLMEEQGVGINHYTKTGKPSFKAEWMLKDEHWLPRLVVKADKLTDLADKFIKRYLVDFSRNTGRVHASINQFRGEQGGTRSHRFSYADPPLQQAPARDEESAAVFRGAFEPEEGETWLSADYSQQEFRLIVHYAYLSKLRRAADARQLYVDDPATDFHQLVADWTGLGRKMAKNVNFAKAYGAGLAKFGLMTGLDEDAARDVISKYDAELPFVRDLGYACADRATFAGYVKMLDGARSHFDFWVPRSRDRAREDFSYARSKAEAERWWPHQELRRLDDHKAMNRLIQGSAARQTKLWMRACWREGFLPLLQMHDELTFSVTSLDQVRRIQALGRDIVELSVPMKVDAEVGASWGDAEYDPEEWGW